MGFMVRRTVALLISVVSAAGAISSCSADAGPSASPAGVATPSASATALGSDGPLSARPRASASPRANARALVTPPAGHAPTSSFAIEERHLPLSRGTARPLPTTVWAPVTGSTGPFPLILFSHGLTSEPSAYAQLLTAWAKAGFVVAAPAYPHTSYGVADLNPLDIANQPADASYVISKMIALNGKAGDELRGRIDTTRIAAAGHSAGGITTIGMFTGDRDNRLVAGIVLAGEQVLPAAFTGPAARMLFVHGKLDKTVPYRNGLAAFQGVPWPKAMMSVTKGGHVTITKEFGPVLDTTTDFWRWSLYGDAGAKARLEADATGGGTATFTADF
jgi:poly(3-hydroxybutyrate) depolymerase